MKRLLVLLIVLFFIIGTGSVSTKAQVLKIIGAAGENTPQSLPSGVCGGSFTISLNASYTIGTPGEGAGNYIFIAPTENSNMGVLYVGKIRLQAPVTNNQFILYSFNPLTIAAGPTNSLTINTASSAPDLTGSIGQYHGSYYDNDLKKLVNNGTNSANVPNGCNTGNCLHIRTYSNLVFGNEAYLYGGFNYTARYGTLHSGGSMFVPMLMGGVERIARITTDTFVYSDTGATGTGVVGSSGYTQDDTYIYGTYSTNSVRRYLKTNLSSRTDYTTTFTAGASLNYLAYDSVDQRLIIPVQNAAGNNHLQAVLASNPAAAPVASYTGFASTSLPYRAYVDTANNKIYVVLNQTSTNKLQVARFTRSTLALEQLYTGTVVGSIDEFHSAFDMYHQKLYVGYQGGAGAADYIEQLNLCS